MEFQEWVQHIMIFASSVSAQREHPPWKKNQITKLTRRLDQLMATSILLLANSLFVQWALELRSNGGRDEGCVMAQTACVPSHKGWSTAATTECPICHQQVTLKIQYHPSERPISYLVASWLHWTYSTLQGAIFHPDCQSTLSPCSHCPASTAPRLQLV